MPCDTATHDVKISFLDHGDCLSDCGQHGGRGYRGTTGWGIIC